MSGRDRDRGIDGSPVVGVAVGRLDFGPAGLVTEAVDVRIIDQRIRRKIDLAGTGRSEQKIVNSLRKGLERSRESGRREQETGCQQR